MKIICNKKEKEMILMVFASATYGCPFPDSNCEEHDDSCLKCAEDHIEWEIRE